MRVKRRNPFVNISLADTSNYDTTHTVVLSCTCSKCSRSFGHTVLVHLFYLMSSFRICNLITLRTTHCGRTPNPPPPIALRPTTYTRSSPMPSYTVSVSHTSRLSHKVIVYFFNTNHIGPLWVSECVSVCLNPESCDSQTYVHTITQTHTQLPNVHHTPRELWVRVHKYTLLSLFNHVVVVSAYLMSSCSSHRKDSM